MASMKSILGIVYNLKGKNLGLYTKGDMKELNDVESFTAGGFGGKGSLDVIFTSVEPTESGKDIQFTFKLTDKTPMLCSFEEPKKGEKIHVTCMREDVKVVKVE